LNILTDDLPEAVLIDGQEYKINTDFRDCLRVILAFEDEELTGQEEQMIMLSNLYSEPIEDTQAALEMGTKFLNGGKVGDEEETGPRLFSFEKDANLIFAAFRQTHNIDLENTEYMHWWKFMALFMDLGSETTFCNLVGLRKRIKNGTASKEERAAVQEMGDLFDIPELDTRTPEERAQEAEFMRMIGAK
jgi:hypothetical protein